MNPKFFKTSAEFRQWLEKNHNKQSLPSAGVKGRESEIWVGMFKKASGKGGIDYDGALEEALCFGWIDGIAKKYDADSYIQRFTPRRSKSNWSKINAGHVERLTREGRMTEAGLAAVEAAQKDGRWEAAYESPANTKVPEDFLEELNKNKKAKEFFDTLNKTNTFAISYRLQTAKKPETKEKRIKEIIEKLEREEKFY